MFRRLGWWVGLNYRSWSGKRLADAQPHPAKIKPVAMFDTVQEIAVYIHRFHNLDLFQQGWYQLKITMRWENSEYNSVGTPARVVQYEAPDIGADDVYGVWMIDDTDNSFSTQPFRIKYARQDVLLSVMISFNLSLGKTEGPPMSAVILKFELMYAPISETGSNLQASLSACSAAVHEFRIPPKALLGLHSYCPVHFDALHAVLVDASVHISLLKGESYIAAEKLPSDSISTTVADGESNGSNQAQGQLDTTDSKAVMLIKSLVAARDILLEELQRFSKAADQVIDLDEFISKMDDIKLSDSVSQGNFSVIDGKFSGQGKLQNVSENENGTLDLQCGESLLSLPKSFHRSNKTRILEYLRDGWAKDRRAEWSIWMVYSKVEMPHHFLNSGTDDSSPHSVHKRVSSIWKLTDDPAQTAAMRAERHRRSIAQMKVSPVDLATHEINNRSIQDMYIFGDPSRIPVLIVERVMNAPTRATSENSYLRHLDVINSPALLSARGSEAVKLTGTNKPKNGRVLKGHHLDLRLVRNQWLLFDPKIECLMSEVNEDKTSGDFREMGLRLAQEVISFLKKKMDKVSRHGILTDIKLSFVGHSIGNIILRTALAESIMEPYLRYLYTYVSISGPHLGYLYSSNSLFNSGLWLLKKFKGTRCIHQLTFTDDSDIQNTFFYNLSKQKTLEHFRHIILLSSPQDGYVPYHSARIDMCQAASWDHSKKGKIFLEMLNDSLDQIRAPSPEQRVFLRCDVNFDTSSYGKNLNTFIGRAAHIEFLESDIFARFVLWSFPELFR
ncbi:hypothetical protein G4B88_028201 [Cannabis sativa]|uniref:DUF676 domain-containing protein n=1 Tax=Cannabis sativa TaxID=3483 RepID=A0A7J6ET86_CANSA|nr:hypothetical protein G4B88_028201 [Cannabis sativa]